MCNRVAHRHLHPRAKSRRPPFIVLTSRFAGSLGQRRRRLPGAGSLSERGSCQKPVSGTSLRLVRALTNNATASAAAATALRRWRSRHKDEAAPPHGRMHGLRAHRRRTFGVRLQDQTVQPAERLVARAEHVNNFQERLRPGDRLPSGERIATPTACTPKSPFVSGTAAAASPAARDTRACRRSISALSASLRGNTAGATPRANPLKPPASPFST